VDASRQSFRHHCSFSSFTSSLLSFWMMPFFVSRSFLKVVVFPVPGPATIILFLDVD